MEPATSLEGAFGRLPRIRSGTLSFDDRLIVVAEWLETTAT